MSAPDFTATIERFTGFGSHYDRVRPAPPRDLAGLLLPMAGLRDGAPPALVVDLGCGTGLATRYWAAHAQAVIGIDPAKSMRAQAETTGGERITYRQGFSHATGLPDACADLVTCSQALHWMDPLPTFAEAARILRPGGVFAACDYDWPPVTGFWEADQAYLDCMARGRRLERELGLASALPQWDKAGHLERIAASGCFRHVRECVLHHEDPGDAERFVGLILSQGYMQTLRKRGLSDADLGLDHLRTVARQTLGSKPSRWLWSARIRLGVR